MGGVSYWAAKSLGGHVTESRPMDEDEALEEGYTILATVEGGPPRAGAADALTQIEMELRVNQGVLPDGGGA